MFGWCGRRRLRTSFSELLCDLVVAVPFDEVGEVRANVESRKHYGRNDDDEPTKGDSWKQGFPCRLDTVFEVYVICRRGINGIG